MILAASTRSVEVLYPGLSLKKSPRLCGTGRPLPTVGGSEHPIWHSHERLSGIHTGPPSHTFDQKFAAYRGKRSRNVPPSASTAVNAPV